MKSPSQRLLNTPLVEAVPAWLAKARGNATARTLAQSEWLLRRKLDGRFLAAVAGHSVRSLDAATLRTDTGIGAALDAIARDCGQDVSITTHGGPLRALEIPADYGAVHGLAPIAEPAELAYAGRDRYRRPLWLLAPAARAWLRMRAAARADDVSLDAISGYRSHAYQLGIFQRKLARGQTIAQILTVNTPPGYSEHHSGRALDIGTPGQPPAEESFDNSPAFAWLQRHAGAFGFAMSYPRDNPHGIVYEPWHWAYAGR
ncbi:MAG: D-alanyl-D-alanine carboxypeptidase family protein [Proteobacteria bacterium]|nr:D-alanyl-D-alanine carboxypeptidase family protein [Pseudomonadota bacterium]MBS0463412.1 D-alanyl-D-alanine carboxypeptidase family protein [Pseudomonadota bacterium]MBS0498761.1 D-alanyl-D-alanine carboxypeptidase family protein [Pseudomonadota bacterium]